MSEERIVPNILTSVSGLAKTGKSHFALSFPAPIVIFNFDIGLEPILKKFANKDVRIFEYPMPIMDSARGQGFQKDLKGIWDKFIDDVRITNEDTEVPTVVIDTWTAVYQIAQAARACELGQQCILKHQFGDVFARLRSICHRTRIAGQNLVLTTYLKEKYVNDQPTGEMVLAGWGETEAQVDVVLRIRRDTKIVPKEGKKNIIVAEIKDNRYDLDLNGYELEMPDYETLIALLGVG